jgi:hypothetical protein
MPCRAVWVDAVQCSALHCSVGGCNVVEWTTGHCWGQMWHRTVQCSAVQCSAVQCSAVQCRGCIAFPSRLTRHHPRVANLGAKWQQKYRNTEIPFGRSNIKSGCGIEIQSKWDILFHTFTEQLEFAHSLLLPSSGLHGKWKGKIMHIWSLLLRYRGCRQTNRLVLSMPLPIRHFAHEILQKMRRMFLGQWPMHSGVSGAGRTHSTMVT